MQGDVIGKHYVKLLQEYLLQTVEATEMLFCLIILSVRLAILTACPLVI